MNTKRETILQEVFHIRDLPKSNPAQREHMWMYVNKWCKYYKVRGHIQRISTLTRDQKADTERPPPKIHVRWNLRCWPILMNLKNLGEESLQEERGRSTQRHALNMMIVSFVGGRESNLSWKKYCQEIIFSALLPPNQGPRPKRQFCGTMCL